MLGEEFETLRRHSRSGRRTEDEHDYYQFTAPAEDGQMVIDVYLSEQDSFTRLDIKHRTNIGHDALFNVLEVFYPITNEDAIWAGNSESYERRRPSEDWGDDSLHTFELYRNGFQWDFDVTWNDMSHQRQDSTPFDFELTVYDGFSPTTDSGSFDPIEKVLPVMMRDDAPQESRGGMLRDIIRLLGEEPEKETVSASKYFEPELFDRYVEETARRFDPHRKTQD